MRRGLARYFILPPLTYPYSRYTAQAIREFREYEFQEIFGSPRPSRGDPAQAIREFREYEF